MCGQRAMWSARGFVTCLTNCITESAPHGDWFYRALQVPQKVFRIKTQSVYLIDHLTVLPSPFFYLSLPHIYLKIGHTVTALLIWRIDKNLTTYYKTSATHLPQVRVMDPVKVLLSVTLSIRHKDNSPKKTYQRFNVIWYHFIIFMYLLTMIVHFKISYI